MSDIEKREDKITTVDMIKEVMTKIQSIESEMNKDSDVEKGEYKSLVITLDNLEDILEAKHIQGLLAFLIEIREPIIVHAAQVNNGEIDLFKDFNNDLTLITTNLSKQLTVLLMNVALDELKGQSKFANLIAVGEYPKGKELVGFSMICTSPEKVINDFISLASAFEENPQLNQDENKIQELLELKVDLYYKGVKVNNVSVKELVNGSPKDKKENK